MKLLFLKIYLAIPKELQKLVKKIAEGTDTKVYLDRDGTQTQYQDSLLLSLENVSTDLNKLLLNQQFVFV